MKSMEDKKYVKEYFKKHDIKSYTWHGTEKSTLGERKENPKLDKDFRSELIKKDGTKIQAKGKILKLIWKWWYNAYWGEFETNALIQVSHQLLGRK